MPGPSTTAALLGPAALPTPAVQNLRPQSQVHFSTQEVGPPSALYVTLLDQVFITVADFLGGRNVFIDYQILTADGQLVQGEEQIVTLAGGATATKTVEMPEGFLVRICARLTGANNQRGETFVALYINRSGGFQHQIAQGYISRGQYVMWPGALSDFPTNGPGRLTTHVVSNPAAGADWSWPGVASNVRARVAMVSATLVTAVAVANRGVVLQIDNIGNPFYDAPAATVQVASLTVTYSAAPGVTPLAAVGNFATIGLPSPTMLFAGWRLRSITSNIQAADQWSNITVVSEEWFDL